MSKSKIYFLERLILYFGILIWALAIILIIDLNQTTIINPPSIVDFKLDTGKVVDHSKFVELQQKFEDPRNVTEACLSCHNMTQYDVMKSSHWTWSRPYITDNGDTIEIGKTNIVNNYCIEISSNQARCTSCHIGYGWENDRFDFNDAKAIDCIVCHDQTLTYEKFPTAAGYPVESEKTFGGKTYYPPDYNLIAQNVGKPKLENCGSCHFSGGGGNNIKHGDLSKELSITKDIDVHMALDGLNMNCIDCHKTEHHEMAGKLYSVSSYDVNRLDCSDCHSDKPHANKTINDHVDRIACQTCHIPTYAKGTPTKIYWDWSKAGKFNDDGSQIVRKDSLGRVVYDTKKGEFVWDEDAQPEYVWFNGNARHYLLGDKVDSNNVVQINSLLGSYEDKNSKIIPVKIHTGRQIYDPINQTLIIPHLFGDDSTSYWKNFDWDKAAATGMESVNLSYSGQYTFVESEMYWPLNHMVAPAENSLDCQNCHSQNGRLENLSGFYLTGRDSSRFFDVLGVLLVVLSIVGVTIHGGFRLFIKQANSK